MKTMDSRYDNPVAPNVLERDFKASAPNTKWVSDITGIETGEGWLYLASSRRYLLALCRGMGHGKRVVAQNGRIL
jgi:transposase InsO family protein